MKKKKESGPKQKWNARRHTLRMLPSERYEGEHKEETWSPVSARSSLSTRSPLAARIPTPARSPLSTRIRTSAGRRDRADSASERRSTYSAGKTADPVQRRKTFTAGKRDISVERRSTVSAGKTAEDPFGLRDINGDASSQPLEGIDVQDKESDDKAEAIEALQSIESLDGGKRKWEDSLKKWEKKAHLNDLPYSPTALPSNAPSEAEQGLGRGELQPSESEQADGNYDEDFPKPRLTNVPNEGDNRQGHIEQMKRYDTEKYPLKSHPKDRYSDDDSRLQSLDSGDALSDDDGVIVKDFGSGISSNKQEREEEPRSPEPDHSIDVTNDREDHAVSDMDQKPDETAISSETPLSSHSSKRDSSDSQLQSYISDPTLLNASPIHDPMEGQVDPEIDTTEETPDATHSPGTVEDKSPGFQPNLPGSDQMKSPDSQPNLLGSDQMKSPDFQPNLPRSEQIKSSDSQPRSPEPGGVAVEISPTQDLIEDDFDPEAWLNSDSPLPGNYRAIFPDDFDDDLRSSVSFSPIDGPDSLVVSPTMPGELDNSEEDSPSTANEDIMKLLAEYKPNFPLKPPSEEQKVKKERRAKTAEERQNVTIRSNSSDSSSTSSSDSDEPLVMSPRKDDEASIDLDTLRTDSEKAKDEEENQAALNLIKLYAANFQLQKTLEEKEAQFKREIKIAWTHPRPPPTTSEHEQDRIALEKIGSKHIFDRNGEQQRPIRTDPRLVLVETDVEIMINRARLNYLLEDFPKMYTHANHAAAAAGQLHFPPLTARCCYYRGLASYHYRDFSTAKADFVASRGCAGLYGISRELIEAHIDLIDKADDPETAVLKRFPNPGLGEVRKTKRTITIRSADVDNENEPSPSTASTLVGSPASQRDIALPLSPLSSANEEQRAAGQLREDANSQSQTLHRPSYPGGLPLGQDPQPSTDDIPNYQPQEEAISEEIRKDIFESKAQSLDPFSDASPAEAKHQERTTLSPPSMASTEWTLLGSTTSQGTARRVPRPYVAPITTSFAKVMSTPVRQAPPETTLISGSRDEMDKEEITAASDTARDDAAPVSGSTDEIDEDEIMREFGAAKGGFIGAQGDDFTPADIEREIWNR